MDRRKCCLCPQTLQIKSTPQTCLSPLTPSASSVSLSRHSLSFHSPHSFYLDRFTNICVTLTTSPMSFLCHTFSLCHKLSLSKGVPLLHARAMKLQCPLVAQWHHNRAKSGPSCRTRCSFMFCCC